MDVALHTRQEEVYYDPTRFKVCAAGRRFGKSFLAAVLLLTEAAKDYKVRTDGEVIDLALEEVFYVGPTFDQSKRNLWPVLLQLGEGLIDKKYENTGTLTLVNGRRISIKGSDRPDTLRGIGLSYVVMDEYAFMKEEVWELIIRPALTRAEGGALFIGTPDGKNHFWELFNRGIDSDPRWHQWHSWHFPSSDNPFLPSEEIKEAKETMSAERYRQEYEASFESGGGHVLTKDMFTIVDEEPYPGDYYIAADLAGFEKVEQGKKLRKLDDHAIAVVKSHEKGWCIVDIIHGKWDTRETALRLVKAYRDYRPVSFGIEKGMAFNAVMPYLEDEQNRLGTYFEVVPCTHGNQKKTDRIAWSLQGRAEKGRIQLLRGKWNSTFLEQAADFPSQLAHDDLLDAVSYIDQISVPWWSGPDYIDEWGPLDEVSGY